MLTQNNPGNIRYDGHTQWRGLADPPDHNGFCVFTDAVYGLRAMVIIISGYPAKHGVRTVRQMIAVFAPAGDNNPEQNYVDYVCQQSGYDADQDIDLTDPEVLEGIIPAICRFENSAENVHYPALLYKQAIDMALPS